ncbi:MAG: TIGR03905 family TSCPD domain-containing protein [Collinsella sp.]|nr:TIGR03905 family TSCPD domain-containing protein [Collinsella sp.]
MITHDFRPRGVCSRSIHIELDDTATTIEGVSFEGGCDGNLKAIGKLVKGMGVDQVVSILEGNTCGRRPTSCADQLTIGLREAVQKVRA